MSDDDKGRFDHKVVLVTGGGSGIGRATALAFARRGANLVIADIDEKNGKATVDDIHALGRQAIFICADVSNEQDVIHTVSATVDAFGRLDCAFNNAGIGQRRLFTAECTRQTWERVLAVNLMGVWLCMKYEIAQMLRQGGGVIVNTSSTAGLAGAPGVPAYAAAKWGVIGLTKTAAIEYARSNIRVNAVCPGVTHTRIVERMIAEGTSVEDLEARIPLGRIAAAEEVAEVVVWLCSSAASFVTGCALPVDGGISSR